MPLLTRSAALTDYDMLARSLGLDPIAMTRAAGLPVQALTDPDLLISGAAVASLLEQSARLCGHADFGLRLAETRRLGNLGDVALVVREEPTLRAAVLSLIRYTGLHNDSLRLRLEDAGEVTLIHVAPRTASWGGGRQAAEMSVAIVLRTLKLLTGEAFQAETVCFTHPAPPDVRTHRRVLGPDVRFDQPADAVVCRTRDLDLPIPTADPEIGRRVKQSAEARLAELGDTTEAQARQLVRTLLPMGLCSVGRLARHLGCDRRTWHRRLVSVGGPNALIDQVRAELAQAYLRGHGRSLTEVSELLGFSAVSAFSRWFRRRFGMSPTAWCQARRAAQPDDPQNDRD